MPKLKHIAFSPQAAEGTARFYVAGFGTKEIGTIDDPGTRGCFLTDGDINSKRSIVRLAMVLAAATATTVVSQTTLKSPRACSS